MNRAEYEEYRRRVADFLTENNVKPGCWSQIDDFPFFSWQPCECCQRSLGGNRSLYEFASLDGENFRGDICSDCEYYLTYGRLDDATMAQIEENEPCTTT